jgi:hypothetical protein
VEEWKGTVGQRAPTSFGNESIEMSGAAIAKKSTIQKNPRMRTGRIVQVVEGDEAEADMMPARDI